MVNHDFRGQKKTQMSIQRRHSDSGIPELINYKNTSKAALSRKGWPNCCHCQKTMVFNTTITNDVMVSAQQSIKMVLRRFFGHSAIENAGFRWLPTVDQTMGRQTYTVTIHSRSITVPVSLLPPSDNQKGPALYIEQDIPVTHLYTEVATFKRPLFDEHFLASTFFATTTKAATESAKLPGHFGRARLCLCVSVCLCLCHFNFSTKDP